MEPEINNLSIPIFFVHIGNPYYLKYTLKQARFFNPDSEIYLLGDESNNKYPFLKHELINDYFEAGLYFEKIYSHMSTNPYWFELICFQRWFIVRDYCIKNNINELVYLDSDALIYCDVTEIFARYKNYKFTVKNQIGPPFSHFLIEDLIELCDYITQMYTDKILSERIKKIWIDYQKINLPGGICDMTVFQQFEVDNPGALFELSTIVKNGTFCIMDKGENQLQAKNDGYLKLKFRNKHPFGLLLNSKNEIEIHGIEFGGHAKKMIPQFYVAGGFFMNRKFELTKFAMKKFSKELLQIKIVNKLNLIRRRIFKIHLL